jgi:hypothetical protein
VDLSGLIFVALAVAWAVYLIPKALKHHDDVVRGRSIDRFSSSMRVLARREPVSAKMARLVVTPTRAAAAAVATAKPSSSSAPTYVDRRAFTARATRRRRRVLLALLVVLAAVVGLCAARVISWTYVAAPVVLLAAWLVACRLMVKKERTVPATRSEAAPVATETPATKAEQPDASEAAPVAVAEPRDPKLWDPVPTTLPTYVGKAQARRSVRTIDLDATGVWTSGRTEADSALAREADAAEQTAKAARATGSTGLAAGS